MGSLVPVVAIDGTAGSGKGTVASLLARRLGFYLLESGRIYRAVGVLALRECREVAGGGVDNARLVAIAGDAVRELMDVVGDGGRPAGVGLGSRLRGNDGWGGGNDGGGLGEVFASLFAGDDLDGEVVGRVASALASIPEVREGLLSLQRAARRAPGLVAEGRDMGTVVFPDAVLKLYLDADLDIRAARRLAQLQARENNPDHNPDHSHNHNHNLVDDRENNRGRTIGKTIGKNGRSRVIIDDVRAGLAARDDRDRNRDCAPLSLADDAVVFDSGKLSADAIVDEAMALFVARR